MEIPELNLISNFEAGVNCLQNPSLFSRFQSFPESYSFWKWGALILALLASFRCIIFRIKFLIIAISNKVKLFAASQPPIQLFGDDFDSDSGDDDDDSGDDSGEDSDDDINSFYRVPSDEDFSVWDRFSLSDLASSKGVVRFWDSLGLGLDFEDDDFSDNVVSVWDLNKIDNSRKRLQIPATSMAAPDVILSGSSYDRRMGLNTSSILAEWSPATVTSTAAQSLRRRSKVGGIGEEDSALNVSDMRNVKSPLKKLTESDGENWWRC
ncbi:uncharacterized protein LOC124935373 [Impatiens glandulifera]|uniref:uncharacterized protein LOC124935373 n=1 Tax=Impatiens glandulifera TaxID=253017 RepID=UPI001FB11377|nr:uncharacterized protein LOC124935373 [Impatiens glandulifera]